MIFLIWVLVSVVDIPPLMPLQKGHKWHYSVVYSTESQKNIKGTFTTEILDFAEQGKYQVTLVRNFPIEFTDMQYLGYKHLVVYDGINYYIISEDFYQWTEVAQSNCCKEFKDGLSVKLPIKPMFLKKKIFGYESSKDVPYKWFGEYNEKAKNHEFSYRTNPDFTQIDVNPDHGIVRYYYKHHGSVDTKEIKLSWPTNPQK